MAKTNKFTVIDVVIFFIFALALCILTVAVILWVAS